MSPHNIGYEFNTRSSKNLNPQLPYLLQSNSAAKLPSHRGLSDREDSPEQPQQRLRKNYSVNQLHASKRNIVEVRHITPNQFTQHREANMVVMSIDKKANLRGMRNRLSDRKVKTQKNFTKFPDEEVASLSGRRYENNDLQEEGTYSELRRSLIRRSVEKKPILGNHSQIELRKARVNIIGGNNPSKEMDSIFMQEDIHFGTNNNSPEPREKQADLVEGNMSPFNAARAIKELKVNRSGPGRRQQQYLDAARRKRLDFLLNELTPSEKEQQQKEGFSSKRRVVVRESPVRIEPTPPLSRYIHHHSRLNWFLVEEVPPKEYKVPRPKIIKVAKEKPAIDYKAIEMKRYF